jgi:ribosome-binding factor A
MAQQRQPGQRQLRVGEEIRHVLAELFLRGGLHDPALADRTITVSEVRMSQDLTHATIFVLPLGGEDVEAVLEGLERATPFIRGEIGRKVRLRLTPTLAFREDKGFDHAERIDRLLKRLDGA